MVSLSLVALISTVLYLNANNNPNYRKVSYLVIFSCSQLGLYWIFDSLYFIGGLPLLLSIFSTALLACYVASFYIVALILSRSYSFSSLEIAALVTSLEGLRSILFSGFPWLEIGVLGIDLPFANVAPFFGSYGVTFFIVFCIATLVNNCNTASFLKITFIILVSVSLSFVSLTEETKKPIKIVLVQGGIPQSIKFDSDQELRNQETYYSLIKKASMEHEGINAIILPETALTKPFELIEKTFLKKLSIVLETNESLLLTGVPNLKNGNWYNSLFSLEANPENPHFFKKIGEYNKRHLVPFGEFIPQGFKWFVDLMNVPLGDFSRGQPLQDPLSLDGHQFVANICFEDLFNWEIIKNLRQTSLKNESSILLNISNLGWFGESNSLKYHLMAARMRSLETAKPTLRSTNTGMTGYIDHRGVIAAVLPPTSPGYLVVEISGRVGNTPFTLFGNTPIALLCIFVLSAGVVRRIFR